MATFEGRGGYVYEELSDGSFKIVKSPKSKGGQIISKDDPVWNYVNAEKKEVGGGEMSRKEAKNESAGYTVSEQQGKLGRPSSVDAPQSEQGARSSFGDARMAAARAAASKDTSPMAMAMEKAKTSPGGTTPGMNRRPTMDMGEQTQAMRDEEMSKQSAQEKASEGRANLERGIQSAGGKILGGGPKQYGPASPKPDINFGPVSPGKLAMEGGMSPEINFKPVSPGKLAMEGGMSSASSSPMNKALSTLGIPPERQEEALAYLKSAYSKVTGG